MTTQRGRKTGKRRAQPKSSTATRTRATQTPRSFPTLQTPAPPELRGPTLWIATAVISILALAGMAALALGLVWSAGVFERHMAGTAMQFIVAFLGIAALFLLRSGVRQLGEAWQQSSLEQGEVNRALRRMLEDDARQRNELAEVLEALAEQDKG